MRKETEAPGDDITFMFPGVRVPPQKHHTWGVSAFLPLPPLAHSLSLTRFFHVLNVHSSLKMVSYLLHRGIVSLS